MTKFLAVLKREYLKRVRGRAFIVATILGPVLMIAFMALPILIALLGTTEPVRLAVVDQTGSMYERVHQALIQESAGNPARGQAPLDLGGSPQERTREMGMALPGAFKVEEVSAGGRAVEEVKQELNGRVLRGELDGYVVIPADVLKARRAEYYGRNVGDLFTRAQLEEKLARAVNEERLTEAGVAPDLLREVTGRLTLNTIKVSERGEEKESEAAFFFVLGIGFLIFIMVLMYGGTILSAVVEEKETRVAEMLFSSVRAFPLMLGKLIGVSLVALTQFAIWGILVCAFLLFGVSALAGQGVAVELPKIGAGAPLYFFLFFLLGYFIYATVYALIGSIVTTQEESQPFVLLAVFPLLVAFYLVFPVLRSPDSQLAFWASLIPFTSPVVMLVRIVTRTPPLWQIALSLAIGFGTIVLLVWVAARIYRMGMLMYGKRASVPEILRWLRQA
ncbi:MAG TPA: ABC transporter permease [Pyrinomonadaceae bacterium]|nr:ABC transporter permease [Pyrinomonadaceae bacterium]